MGLFMRRRRPAMRLAAGAAVGTAAYQAGKRHEQQAEVNDEAQAAYAATQGVAAPPTEVATEAATDGTAEIERLAQLHASGALTDDEFAAAKAKVLGL